MKNRYIVSIIIVIVATIGIISYKVDLPPFGSRRIMIPKTHNRSYSGASFITTFSDKQTPVPGAKNTHTCLAGNDESCFLITVWSGNYASYFNAYRIAIYDQLMNTSGSEVTIDDMKSQLTAGFHEVMAINGLSGTTWHLVDIGMEAQHLYVERPRGTLIVTDMLGLKGASYPDRQYINYVDMPQHLNVK